MIGMAVTGQREFHENLYQFAIVCVLLSLSLYFTGGFMLEKNNKMSR